MTPFGGWRSAKGFSLGGRDLSCGYGMVQLKAPTESTLTPTRVSVQIRKL